MTTTTNYGAAGAHELNKWLWSKLQDFVWNGTDRAFAAYDEIGLVPIIPTQQVPEFTDIVGGAPFLVYNYANNPIPTWWVNRETCAYIIYDNNEARLRAIYHYIFDLVKRQDWTAREVNAFLGNSAWDFKYVTISTATGPGNFTDEGGRQGAMVVASYEYTHDIDGAEGSGMRT